MVGAACSVVRRTSVPALGMALYSVSRGRMSLPARLARGSELAAEREGAADVAGAGAGRTRGPTLKANGGQGSVVEKIRGRQISVERRRASRMVDQDFSPPPAVRSDIDPSGFSSL